MWNKHILIMEKGDFGEWSKESLGCEAQAVTFLTQAALPVFPLFCAWSHAVQAATIYLTHSKGAFRHLTNCVTYATNKCLWLFSTMNYDICFELYIWGDNQPGNHTGCNYLLQQKYFILQIFITLIWTHLYYNYFSTILTSILLFPEKKLLFYSV